jgi:hypothetical protein
MDETKFDLNDSITVEGITAEHVWYNADILTRNMTSWTHDFQKLVSVMEARHKEHLNMIAELLMERAVLKREIAAFEAVTKE